METTISITEDYQMKRKKRQRRMKMCIVSHVKRLHVNV
jgi:hypothetical protein